MIKNKEIENIIEAKSLFATTIWNSRVPSYGIFNQQWNKYLYDLRDTDPKNSENHQNTIERGLIDKSTVNATWHSPYLNPDDKMVAQFTKMVEPALIAILNNEGWNLKDNFISYESIWSIIQNKGSYHMPHHHGDSLYSIAYYTKIPKDNKGGAFYFKDPRGMVKGSPLESPTAIEFDPQEGDILIFPGWLEHGVKQHHSDEDRIVISLNIKLLPKKAIIDGKLVNLKRKKSGNHIKQNIPIYTSE